MVRESPLPRPLPSCLRYPPNITPKVRGDLARLLRGEEWVCPPQPAALRDRSNAMMLHDWRSASESEVGVNAQRDLMLDGRDLSPRDVPGREGSGRMVGEMESLTGMQIDASRPVLFNVAMDMLTKALVVLPQGDVEGAKRCVG